MIHTEMGLHNQASLVKQYGLRFNKRAASEIPLDFIGSPQGLV